MAIVYGKIESLKQVKLKLRRNGITCFNSIGEINSFIRNYGFEKQKIISETEVSVNLEIVALKEERIKVEKNYNDLNIEEKKKLENRIIQLKERYKKVEAKNGENLIRNIVNTLQLRILKFISSNLEKKFNWIISKKTYKAYQRSIETSKRLSEYISNKKKVIDRRCDTSIKQLNKTKKVVDELYPLIAGAIGENLVVKELEKLSDKYVLINDYANAFVRPIYNKRENDKIFGFQIDHLLVTNCGIFVIETKNWSKKSIERYDLRSPIKQVKRASYALFIMLNGDSRHEGIDLKKHHWGDKQIPVRNIIVMINHKPREKFKYVEVTTLNELNRYISYFDPIFEDDEVTSIAKNLMMIGLPIESEPNL